MAKKKTKDIAQDAKAKYPEKQAPATPQLITDTIITNYMPYVMSVIVSRATVYDVQDGAYDRIENQEHERCWSDHEAQSARRCFYI